MPEISQLLRSELEELHADVALINMLLWAFLLIENYLRRVSDSRHCLKLVYASCRPLLRNLGCQPFAKSANVKLLFGVPSGIDESQ